jgi:hypothetical protein
MDFTTAGNRREPQGLFSFGSEEFDMMRLRPVNREATCRRQASQRAAFWESAEDLITIIRTLMG